MHSPKIRIANSKLITLLTLLFIAISLFSCGKTPDAPRDNRLMIEGGQYECSDLGPFCPSGAVYFMDGFSEASIKILATGDTFTVRFVDKSTSIAASAPLIYSDEQVSNGMFVPVPQPLKPIAYFPKQVPDRYRRNTTLHLMQVISMNMKSADGSRLLIGLPYAEKYPELFASVGLFDGGMDASSYGVVQSLTNFKDSTKGSPNVNSNGYPARSIFAIYHIIETKFGTFFNKKATVMELQPDKNGKLALTLPPIPFDYELHNGPIPLFDVKNPKGPSVAEVVAAKHGSHDATTGFSPDTWPVHTIVK